MSLIFRVSPRQVRMTKGLISSASAGNASTWRVEFCELLPVQGLLAPKPGERKKKAVKNEESQVLRYFGLSLTE